MSGFQKIIKYAAIAFGLYLAVTIISIIVSVILALSAGLYGVQMITEQADVEKVDITKEFEQFYKMNLKINSASLIIKAEGEVFKVETTKMPETTKIENKNGTLEIWETKTWALSSESKVIIYIPENTKIEEIDLEMGTGTLNISNIISNKVDFNFGAGSVYIDNLASMDADIECGAGQVIVDNADLTNVNIDSGVGKLVYSGYMKGYSEIECGVGSIEINLEGGNEIYQIKADKGIGEIKINNEKVSDNSITGNGENTIKIEGGIGSIEIKM